MTSSSVSGAATLTGLPAALPYSLEVNSDTEQRLTQLAPNLFHTLFGGATDHFKSPWLEKFSSDRCDTV